ncbi:2,3-diketo-5-methylthio-1-phosphopentane phosphatase [Solidesulfovibrio fructosivorans JJ]]|uniref:2,3-diketo-5-methylthio-1-phosphopentane phosphatase n=1 Tax=Solidesulfovibrio fructosivorans JJ] TaxID=596151 RepID=E1JZP3_SOLFR|nr:HAD-IB family phosphatase [Solidesulfovibrio fructosivorans]EFL50178.1 2,3-diketo-5-methylthio-1-phosphopentane phosphatase [Solidesulfovibrio fructosivorans JJ]]
MPDAVLVSDFDGTMTADDFYRLVATRLLPPEALAPWDEYRAGRMTHFQALKTIFSRIRAPEEDVLAVVADMGLDPGLAASLDKLRRGGFEVVVASAGCDWYIRRLLAGAGVTLEVHANPGTYRPGGPLVMDAPPASPLTCPETGVDKAAVVRDAASRASVVAFAGDGFADLPAALLVPRERRFARADLAQALAARGETFRTFSVWSDIADMLLAGEART